MGVGEGGARGELRRFAGLAGGVPLLWWTLGGPPARTPGAEALSFVALVGLGLLGGLLYLTRAGAAGPAVGNLLRVHRIAGYGAVAAGIAHPFLVVAPRFWEPGITPADALATLVSRIGTPGLGLGALAWVACLGLGVTALWRGPLAYRTWRLGHGWLGILAALSAAGHALVLGRHRSAFMAVTAAAVVAGGIYRVLRGRRAPERTGGIRR